MPASTQPHRIMYVRDLEVGKSYKVIIGPIGIHRICKCTHSTGTRATIVDTTGRHISLGLTDLIDTKAFRV
jgi:hypothetical protein